MSQYIQKRGAMYYFRRPIPLHIQPVLTADERKSFHHSLGTKDLAQAKRLSNLRRTDTDTLIENAEQRVGNSQIVSAVPSKSRAQVEAEWKQLEYEEAYAAYEEGEAAREEAQQEAIAPILEMIEADIKRPLAELPPERAAIKQLLMDREFDQALARDRAAIRELKNSRLATAPTRGKNSDEAVLALSGQFLDDEVVEGWALERRPTEKTVNAHKAAAQWLYNSVGRKPVGSITRQDIIAFKAKLLADETHPNNINTKLRRISTLFQWAYLNGHSDQNPAKGVNVQAVETEWAPFKTGHLNKLFSSPVFEQGARPKPGRAEAAYWLPVIALFTGARREEIGQLRLKDLREEFCVNPDGGDARIWVFDITDDVTDKMALKNRASKRLVPVHATLIELGLLTYRKTLMDEGAYRLFPALPDLKSRRTAKWGEWFSKYKRETCGLTEPGLVFHSFRHAFKDCLRDAEIQEGIQRRIMGHEADGVAGGYGDGHSLFRVAEAMRKVRYPGLLLPPPPRQSP